MSEEDRIAEILGDWIERQDRGEEVSPDDVIRAHPELAEELRAHFGLLWAVESAFPRSSGLPEGMPREIGEFLLVREIGRGGMGAVYEAEQASMDRRVAVKILSPSFTSTRQAVARFRREARAAGRLHHTNVVPVYALGEDRGFWFYAMELVDGPPLSRVIAAMRGADDPAAKRASDFGEAHLGSTTRNRAHFLRVAEKMAGVAEALHTAHEEGIIHGDVRPRNLLLDADGVLKVVDFGLARLEGGPSVTVAGRLPGDPRYMSPEQAMSEGVEIDARTDIYSLGATIYEVLTLAPPFTGDSHDAVRRRILSRDPVPPRKSSPRVPRDLEAIVLMAMEKDRDRRYPTALKLARDLRRFAAGAPIRARRIGPVGRAWRRVRGR